MTSRFEVFTTKISQIYKSLQKIKTDEMKNLGLKSPDVLCLFELNKHPSGLTLTELSTACDKNKAAVSRTVTLLKKKGFATSNDDFKYRSPILLTKQGRDVADHINWLASYAVEQCGAGVTDEEREIFYKVLTIIADNMKNYPLSTNHNEPKEKP